MAIIRAILLLMICNCLSFTFASIPFSGSGPAEGLLLVANKGDRSLGLIDPGSCLQVAEIPEGGITGHEVVASPDGRTAYVPIYGNAGVGKPGTDGSSVVVIDIVARKVTARIDFRHGVRPHHALFGPRDGLLYVTTELDNSVRIINPRTLEIVGSIATGQPESHMLAITRDGRRGYTANVGPGTISVLDLEARKLSAVIPVSNNVQRIALSTDDSLAFTSDQTQPRLAVIDTSTNRIKSWVALPATGYGTAPSSDGRYLLVALPKLRSVAVVDLAEMRVARTIKVPRAPQEILVRPDNRLAYVSCSASNQVAVIDMSDWTIRQIIDAGKGVDGLAWAPRP